MPNIFFYCSDFFSCLFNFSFLSHFICRLFPSSSLPFLTFLASCHPSSLIFGHDAATKVPAFTFGPPHPALPPSPLHPPIQTHFPTSAHALHALPFRRWAFCQQLEHCAGEIVPLLRHALFSESLSLCRLGKYTSLPIFNILLYTKRWALLFLCI